MARKSHTVIGLMSGTSVDSIDAAAARVRFGESGLSLERIRGITHPIPGDVREEIFRLFDEPAGALRRLTLLNMRLGSIFAEAALRLLEEANLQPQRVTVIGSHGQTIHHVSVAEQCCGQMLRGSLQIAEGSVIAQKTGIPVVSDFRPADIAAGGAGAPLVPFLDSILFAGSVRETAAQNIGGIGNVTFVPKGTEKPVAFDTGPGNMIIDLLAERYTGGRLSFDRDGEIGRSGSVRNDLLERWLQHPFFSQAPPKSAGREEFGTSFWTKYLKDLPISADLVRTAEELTTRSIAQAYRDFLPRMPERVVLTGGGAHNPVLKESLARLLPQSEVCTGEEVGIDVDFKEALAFAVMGLYRFLGLANNVPEATGAGRKVVMGKLSLP